MNKIKALISKYKKTSKIAIIIIFLLASVAIAADVTGHSTWYGTLFINTYCAIWAVLCIIGLIKWVRT